MVHAAPSPDAQVLATWPEYRREDFHPTPVLAVSARSGSDGETWYRIVVPGRPNGGRGWVRGDGVTLGRNPWQVVVHRASRELQLWRGDRLAHRAKVAVGAPGMETPLGLFYVTFRFRPVKQPFLGTYAFATSAYSKLSDWPGGGIVGLHGTYQPSAARPGGVARVRPDVERDRELPPRPHPGRHADPHPADVVGAIRPAPGPCALSRLPRPAGDPRTRSPSPPQRPTAPQAAETGDPERRPYEPRGPARGIAVDVLAARGRGRRRCEPRESKKPRCHNGRPGVPRTVLISGSLRT